MTARSSRRLLHPVDVTDELRALEFFRDCDSAMLQTIAKVSSVRHLEKGRRVRTAVLNDNLVVLARGRAKRTTPRGSEGELVLDIVNAGEVLFDSCLVPERHAFGGETVAIEDCVAVLVPRGAFDDFLGKNAQVAIRFLEKAAMRLARTSTLAAQNACFPAADRLYCRLVELAVTCSAPTVEGLHIEHGLTQQELAAFAAASREIVNRQLADWRARDWIRVSRRAVLIRDVAALTNSVCGEARWVGFGAGDGRNVFGGRA